MHSNSTDMCAFALPSVGELTRIDGTVQKGVVHVKIVFLRIYIK